MDVGIAHSFGFNSISMLQQQEAFEDQEETVTAGQEDKDAAGLHADPGQSADGGEAVAGAAQGGGGEAMAEATEASDEAAEISDTAPDADSSPSTRDRGGPSGSTESDFLVVLVRAVTENTIGCVPFVLGGF